MCFIFAQFLSNFDGLYNIEKILLSELPFYLGGLCYLWIISVVLNFPILMMSGLSYGEFMAGRRFKEKYPVGSFVSLSRYSAHFFVGPCPKLMKYLFKDNIPRTLKPLGKLWVSITLIILLLGSLTAPIIRSLRYGGSITRVTKIFTLDDMKEMEKESRLSSQRLQFALKLPSSFFTDWILFPRFDLIKEEKRALLSSYLHIQSIKTANSGDLERSRKLNLSELLLSEFESHTHLERNNENLRADLLNLKGQSWSAASKEELRDLLSNSLTFGASLQGQIINQFYNGPFISGNLSLRAEIKKIIPLTKIDSFSFIKLGHHSFILFSGSFHKTKRYAFFSLEEKRPYVYSLSWQGSRLAMDHFMSLFFKKAAWQFSDDKDFWSYPSTPSDITVTHLMDMVIEQKLSTEHQNSLEVALYMYYFNLYKKALLENNVKLTGAPTIEIRKMDRVINLKKKNMTPVFIARWNSLVTNALSTNKKYFGVEK